MRFYAVGLNHESASVDQTEAYSLDAEAQEALYDDLSLQDEAEVVVLSTCNRTEAYLYGTESDVLEMERALEAAAEQPLPDEGTFRLRDESAVRHLLQVTSGLRSMVLGDSQILAQVKTAYQRAVDAGAVHSLMHRLLHTAFRAAKRVSTETEIERGAASVSTAAVEMARQYLSTRVVPDPFPEVEVVLVGAGKMGRLALEAMGDELPRSLTVVNRSIGRARDVAEAFDGEVVRWPRRHEVVSGADFVIVATGAPAPIVNAEALPAQPTDPETLIVDIAMPRNVDPSVQEREGYTVYDLDDLNAWTEKVRDRRASAVPEAESICEEELQDFVTWVFHQQALQPAIQAIRRTFETIRAQEVDRHAHRTDMDRSEVDRLTKSIMQKLLAVPIVRLKNVDPDSIDFVQGIKLLQALFSPAGEDEGGGRTLQRAAEDEPPSLGDAPSRCPYLTHDPEAGAEDHEASLDEVLRMSDRANDLHEDPAASSSTS